jgi:ribonuclease HI
MPARSRAAEAPPDPSAWQIVFDGGSQGNPGRGYGSFRLRPPGGDWGPPVRLEFGGGVTNNEAEYRSLIAALQALARAAEPARTSVVVLGDSQLVIRHLKGEWRVKADNLRPLHAAARQAAAPFAKVAYRWQRRDRSVELLGH